MRIEYSDYGYSFDFKDCDDIFLNQLKRALELEIESRTKVSSVVIQKNVNPQAQGHDYQLDKWHKGSERADCLLDANEIDRYVTLPDNSVSNLSYFCTVHEDNYFYIPSDINAPRPEPPEINPWIPINDVESLPDLKGGEYEVKYDDGRIEKYDNLSLKRLDGIRELVITHYRPIKETRLPYEDVSEELKQCTRYFEPQKAERQIIEEDCYHCLGSKKIGLYDCPICS